ncbi:ATPase, vacuolar ER assembly factor, Vma12 [Niveomyces insectorum RCEF 264]|uniref:ATPase, vacuolar ER assembly factor, Vma12 n=1 Tax=Niveomyces insectorum RCEF 264 TaxID=1081102 RepID=A0A167SGK4_9HYPO|nr:ATPase, vacuolar ER assembly factor, Vma12 [Niveomyces insectorum RCEF 264]
MVLLTMTPSMVEGLKRIQVEQATGREDGDEAICSTTANDEDDEDDEDEPPVDLGDPAVGRPISHRQVLQLWKTLSNRPQKTAADSHRATLEALLVGAAVYVPPPPPKPQPTPEFQALMARLRRDEEARAYARMVRPTDYYATATPAAAAFAQVHAPQHAHDIGDDGVTLADVNRQAMLLLNFLLTMGGVAYALWVLARWWPTPARLFLAMGGSAAVGAAEYGLYAGYVWHLAEAKKKDDQAGPSNNDDDDNNHEGAVVKTWVVVGSGADSGDGDGDDKEAHKDTDTDTDTAAGQETNGASEERPHASGANRADASLRRRRKEAAETQNTV